jgi:hypothetical protein
MIPLGYLVGAPGFEPRTSCAQGSCKKSILLVRLALFCVMVHGFGPTLSAVGLKLDLSSGRQLACAVALTVLRGHALGSLGSLVGALRGCKCRIGSWTPLSDCLSCTRLVRISIPPPRPKSPSSARCFMDAKMFTRVASKAARLAGQAIHRYVVMNGSRASAKNQGSNVPNVPTSVFFP